jgi:dTDP-4-dehydrorhamnose reductase
MGRRLANIMGAADAPLVSASQSAAAGPARRPADVSLDSRQAFELGYEPLGLDEALAIAVDDQVPTAV